MDGLVNTGLGNGQHPGIGANSFCCLCRSRRGPPHPDLAVYIHGAARRTVERIVYGTH